MCLLTYSTVTFAALKAIAICAMWKDGRRFFKGARDLVMNLRFVDKEVSKNRRVFFLKKKKIAAFFVH